MKLLQKHSLLSFSLGVYIASLAVTDLLVLPYVGNMVQLPEIFFVLLVAVLLFTRPVQWKAFRFPLLTVDYALLFLLGAFVHSALFGISARSWLEVLGITYFLSVYAVLNYCICNRLITVESLLPPLRVAGYITAISGIAGWLLAQFGADTALAWPKDALFPYFQGFGRADGFFYNPNNLLSFAGVCFFFETAFLIRRGQPLKWGDWAYLFLLLAAGVLSFSKLIVLYFIGWLWMLYWLGAPVVRRRKKLLWAGSIALAMVFYLATHVVFIDSASPQYEQLWKAGFILKEPFGHWGGLELCWTNYSVNKYAAFRAGLDHFPFGLGAGQYVHSAADLIASGYFPSYFPPYEPHSTVTGAWAELGGFGLLALAFLYFSVGKLIHKGLKSELAAAVPLFAAGAAVLLVALLDGVVTDTLFQRHYWVVLAVAVAACRTGTLPALGLFV